LVTGKAPVLQKTGLPCPFPVISGDRRAEFPGMHRGDPRQPVMISLIQGGADNPLPDTPFKQLLPDALRTVTPLDTVMDKGLGETRIA